jgi:hypothetical protein
MDMTRWTFAGLLSIAFLSASCGGSPNAPTVPGVSISALLVQIQNQSDGGHGYAVSYTVHNGGPSDATLTGVEASLSAKGTVLQSFSIGFPGGRPAPASQFVSPTTTTFSVSAGTPVADSLTLTVHYDAGSGEQIVTRTAPLG